MAGEPPSAQSSASSSRERGGSPDLPVVGLKKAGLERVRSGELWIFRNEVVPSGRPHTPGEMVKVVDGRQRLVGVGFVNPRSSIFVRLLVNCLFERSAQILGLLDADTLDEDALFRARLRQALAWRETWLPGRDAVRLVYGESDFLPGLIVDRYASLLVLQITSLGMDCRRTLLVRLLAQMTDPEGIVERSSSPAREKEGLDPKTGWILGGPQSGAESRIWIEEEGAAFLVDVTEGQKTGFYLDQRDNRQVLRRLSSGKRVLDCFCHSGAFSVFCALGGAASVTGIDASSPAVALAGINAARNNVADRCRFAVADCLDFLADLPARSEDYDLIILDPPAFARGRNAVLDASRGYREINFRALKSLPRQGLLATASCSQVVDAARFLDILRSAAKDARRSIRQVFAGCHALDHPVLLSMPQTAYLKFFIFEVS